MKKRITGTYLLTSTSGEEVRSFLPTPLPPNPPLDILPLQELHSQALQRCALLNLASKMVPDQNWFIYGFVRKEAVVSSQIEGTQATLLDVLKSESAKGEDSTQDIEETVNYVRALHETLQEISHPQGLPLSLRLIKKAHKILMTRTRGAKSAPGEFRKSQNWIGGTRPGNAHFVPPPPNKLEECLNALENYLHNTPHDIPPLIKAGIIHVQFETIHPFLDGNGRTGRLLITLLLQEWKILEAPLLYLSLYFKKTRAEYYERLSKVRIEGDWEGWCEYFLKGVNEIAQEGAEVARKLFAITTKAKNTLLSHPYASVAAVRLLELLPRHPIITTSFVVSELNVSKPTAQKAIDVLVALGILQEISGKQRGKRFTFHEYLIELARDTEPLSS